MGRKTITTYKLNKIKKLVNEGKTIKEISGILKISTATVANYRAHFKKKGEITFPTKKTISTENSPTIVEDKLNLNVENSSSVKKECTYIFNGTKLVFSSQPKEIIFTENKIIIKI